jgi:hypothetical protein
VRLVQQESCFFVLRSAAALPAWVKSVSYMLLCICCFKEHQDYSSAHVLYLSSPAVSHQCAAAWICTQCRRGGRGTYGSASTSYTDGTPVLQLLRPRCLDFAHSCVAQSCFLRRRLRQLVLLCSGWATIVYRLPRSWSCAYGVSYVVVSCAGDGFQQQPHQAAGAAVSCYFRSGVRAQVALIASKRGLDLLRFGDAG